MSFRNLGAEKFQEQKGENLSFLEVWKKQSPRHGGEMVRKKSSPRISWTMFFPALKKNRVQEALGLCFFHTISPHVWDSVFFLHTTKIYKFSPFWSWNFQHQSSGNSFRGAKGSLYWSCPIQIPSKCWGWSNLVLTLVQTCSGTFMLYFGHFLRRGESTDVQTFWRTLFCYKIRF